MTLSEALYERYKEALRQGHIAALRGRHEAAVAAYRAAAELAPDRPLPFASLGAAYLRLERPDEALEAFDAALARAGGDESALAGRADALVALRRHADAAAALDRLADAQDAAGRVADACDSTRRALELAEGRSRRRRLRELVSRLREANPGADESDAVVRALHVLDAAALESPAPGAPAEGPAADTLGSVTDAAAAGAAAAVAAAASVDPVALTLDADAALDAGDSETARRLLREALSAHRRLEQRSAAIDAAARALAIDPLATDLHLALAEVYLDRGWRTLAGEKLVLLARLATLTGDETTRDAVRSLATARLPDHEALEALTA